MIEGDPKQRWRKCRVLDISTTGAGLELQDSSPEETEGRRIILAVQLTAEVRYARQGDDGLRAGAQFVDLTDAERAYIESIVKTDSRY